MDPIKELLAKLSGDQAHEVTDEQIREALATIQETATSLATQPVTQESVVSLQTLVSQQKALFAVQAARAAEAGQQDDAGTLAEQSKALLDELAEHDGTHDPARDHVQQDPEAAPVPDPGQPGGGEDEAADDKTKAGTKKAAPKSKRPERQLGDLTTDPDDAPANGGTVTAITRVAGSIPGHAVGGELSTSAALAKAFREKANALSTPSAAGRHDVARIEFTYPEERVLRGNATEDQNTAKINAVTGPEAITAAGGLCLPLEVRYDIATIGVTDRPVKNALSGFQTERGGLQYRAPFDALAMTDGLGVWTQADDAAVDPDDPLTLKSCFTVSCPGVLEASIYSTYMCLEFPNMTARFDTEWVAATTDSSMVAWARFAENQLLSRLFSGSKIIAGVHRLGAVRDLLLNFDQLAAYYRSRHRLNDAVPLRMIAPRWLIDLLRSDLAMAFSNASPAEVFGIAQATLESFLATRNIQVTWHLDGLDAPGAPVSGITIPQQYYGDLAAGATVPPFPTAADVLLYREGDWLFLDGGTLDLGLVRDSQLNLRNRYQTFVETFEGVAFTGKECLRMVIPLVPSGASTGTIDPHAIDPTLPAAA